ncbi:MAG: hypothetical protein ACRDIF_02765, partial [Actinomycetota bacterium]
VAGAAALVLALAGVVSLAIRRSTGPGGRGDESVQPTALPFIPPTRTDGALKVMPLVLPDGTSLELIYGGPTDLAALGARPFISGELEGCCQRQLVIEHGQAQSFYRTTEPGPKFPGAQGNQVRLAEDLERTGKFLVFQFRDWNVGLSDGDTTVLTPSQQASFASSLGGRVTPEGFLVLEAKPPLSLVPAGKATGPGMELGSIRRRGVVVMPRACTPFEDDRLEQVEVRDGTLPLLKTGRGRFFALLCLADLQVQVQAYGDESFIRSALGSLTVRAPKPPPAPGPAPPSP